MELQRPQFALRTLPSLKFTSLGGSSPPAPCDPGSVEVIVITSGMSPRPGSLGPSHPRAPFLLPCFPGGPIPPHEFLGSPLCKRPFHLYFSCNPTTGPVLPAAYCASLVRCCHRANSEPGGSCPSRASGFQALHLHRKEPESQSRGEPKRASGGPGRGCLASESGGGQGRAAPACCSPVASLTGL